MPREHRAAKSLRRELGRVDLEPLRAVPRAPRSARKLEVLRVSQVDAQPPHRDPDPRAATPGRQLSDYTFVLDSGELLAEGPVNEVLSRPEVIEAYLGT